MVINYGQKTDINQTQDNGDDCSWFLRSSRTTDESNSKTAGTKVVVCTRLLFRHICVCFFFFLITDRYYFLSLLLFPSSHRRFTQTQCAFSAADYIIIVSRLFRIAFVVFSKVTPVHTHTHTTRTKFVKRTYIFQYFPRFFRKIFASKRSKQPYAGTRVSTM